MTKQLVAAKACARAWKLVNACLPVRDLERNLVGMVHRARLLNHPFVQIDRGFVFIHVPKTAGTSLREALGLHSSLDIPCHAPARDVMPMIKQVAPRAISIAFVRNPYTRFVSLYNYARQDESLYHSVKNPEHAPYGKHIDYDILSDKSLEECAELLVQGKLGGHGVWLNLWRPQVEWLINREGELMVDFIGRVETLETDLQRLATLHGITAGPVPWLNKSAAIKETPRFTDRALELVRLYYRRDFEMLGYDETHVPDAADGAASTCALAQS